MTPSTWKGWLGWLSIALAAAALLAWALWPRALEVDVGEARDERFERVLVRDGKTRLRERHIVTAPVTGRLARITLREGDRVQAGQALATLAPTANALLDARGTQEQRERVAALEAQWRRTQVQMAQAESALAQARADLARSQALAAQGFVSPVQTEQQGLAARLREAERDAAGHEEAAARHQLALAQVALQPAGGMGGMGGMASPGSPANSTAALAAAVTAALTVRSPVAGQVIRLHKDSAGEVAQGAPLLEVGDLAQLEVLVDLLTDEAQQVRPGMPATLAGGTGPLPAQVLRIDPGAFTKVSALGVEEQRVNVVLGLTAPRDAWAWLGDAFRIESRIVVQQVPRARVLPASAVFPASTRDTDSRMAVFVLRDGHARLTPVTVHARNPQWAWVDDSLPAGTPVVLYPPTRLRDGDRVRARATP